MLSPDNSGACDWCWLRRVPRPPHAAPSPCLAVLEGHTDWVGGALELRDGRLLSWSGDHTLRLWTADGAPLATLAGHTDPVEGALELRDGRLLSWSGDHTLRLWTADGAPLATLEGHTDGVKGALELRDGRLLSWSEDKTLRLWTADGVPPANLERLTAKVWEHLPTHLPAAVGALELRDGRLLSWSDGLTLQLWTAAGAPLTTLEGHTRSGERGSGAAGRSAAVVVLGPDPAVVDGGRGASCHPQRAYGRGRGRPGTGRSAVVVVERPHPAVVGSGWSVVYYCFTRPELTGRGA